MNDGGLGWLVGATWYDLFGAAVPFAPCVPGFPNAPALPVAPLLPRAIIFPLPNIFRAITQTTGPPEPPEPPAPPVPGVAPVAVPGDDGFPFPPGTPTVSLSGFAIPVEPVALPGCPATFPVLFGHESESVSAGVVAPVLPTVPAAPPVMALKPAGAVTSPPGSTKTPRAILFIFFIKNEGIVGIEVVDVEPPPAPPSRYVT